MSIGEESSRAPERLRTTWNRETGRRDGEVCLIIITITIITIMIIINITIIVITIITIIIMITLFCSETLHFALARIRITPACPYLKLTLC